MKDEAGGKIITEFVGLRAKLYSYKIYEDPSEYKKCKGVKKNVVKRCIVHEDYKKCLSTGEEQSANIFCFSLGRTVWTRAGSPSFPQTTELA